MVGHRSAYRTALVLINWHRGKEHEKSGIVSFYVAVLELVHIGPFRVGSNSSYVATFMSSGSVLRKKGKLVWGTDSQSGSGRARI